MERLSRIALVLLFSLAGAAHAESTCSTSACGTITCPGGCYQNEVNGECLANYCTDGLALPALARPARAALDCAPNAVSGSNSVSGCGNVVSGERNVVEGNRNVVSGTDNYVTGNCLVVSGVGGFYSGDNCGE